MIDRFTYATLDYLQRMKVGDWIRDASLRDLFDFYDPRMLFSTPDYRADILGRRLEDAPITDFFGSVLDIQLHYDDEAYPLDGSSDDEDALVTHSDIVATEPTTRDRSSRVTNAKATTRHAQFAFSADFAVVGLAFALTFAVAAHKKL